MTSTTKAQGRVSAYDAKRLTWKVLALSLVLMVSDLLLGPTLGLPVFFIVPVMLAAWFSGVRLAVTLAVFLAVFRFFVHWAWQFPLELLPAVVNNVMRCVTFVAVGYVTARAAKLIRDLRTRVELLEQQLPVCKGCGVIKRPDGSWGALESLPETPPERRPLCPACEEKHYGAYS